MIWLSVNSPKLIEAPKGKKTFGTLAKQEWEFMEMDECFEQMMKFLNEEVLAKGHTPVDFNISRVEEDEKVKNVAYVLYDDKGVLPKPPGKRLIAERENFQCIWYESEEKNTKKWLLEKAKAAGNRFWKHCICMRADFAIGEASILRWDDVEFEEVNYEFHYERSYPVSSY